MSDIATVVKDLLATHLQLPVTEITDASDLTNDLGADSIDVLEIAMLVEEQYKIEIPADHLQAIGTVEQLVAYVQGHVRA